MRLKQKNKIQRKRRGRCDICGKLKCDVYYQVNPYIQDIDGKNVKENICGECYNILCMDI